MILAIDFETSHLDPNIGAPVTMGVAVMNGSEVIASKEWLFAPPTSKDGKISRQYNVEALEISRASWAKIKREGMPCSRVMHELSEFAKENKAEALTVVAFNASFDFAWYSTCLFLGGSWDQSARCFKTFQPPIYGAWQCVRLLASRLISLDRYSLDSVSAHFGFERSGEKHGALEDAILAGKVYHQLCELSVAGKVPA